MDAYFKSGAIDEDGKELRVKILTNGVEFTSFEEYEKSHDAARRITAAVNACAGIPTELLEEGIIKKAMADFEMMRVENSRMKQDLQELSITNTNLARLGMERADKANALAHASEMAIRLLSQNENDELAIECVRRLNEALNYTGYTQTEQNCKGCFGPCGMCEEPEIGRLKQLKASIYTALEEWNKTTDNTKFIDAVRVALITEHREPRYFIGTEDGIEDIDELPEEFKPITIEPKYTKTNIKISEALNEAMMEAEKLRAERKEAEMYPPDQDEPENDMGPDYQDLINDQAANDAPTPYDP